MHFAIIGEISNIRPIAAGPSVRIRRHLVEKFGRGRWRKMAGEATIRFGDGTVEYAELHWFEAHAIGRVYIQRKRSLDERR